MKDVFEMSTLFHFQYVSLINPNAENLLSHGYQVLCKISSDIENQMYILCDVADKYALALEIEKDGLIIIYRPVKKGIDKPQK
jgi:hypothetical protein